MVKPDAVQLPPHADAGFVPQVLVDKVRYSALTPWPTAAASGSNSLQRIDPAAYGNDPANWIAALAHARVAPTSSRFVDTDGDGMDDNWEMIYFHTLARDGTGDFDGDGTTDFQEYLAGTDPTNPADVLRLSITVASPATLKFIAVAGKTYTIQYRDSLGTGLWQRLADVPAQPGTGLVSVAESFPRGRFPVLPYHHPVATMSFSKAGSSLLRCGLALLCGLAAAPAPASDTPLVESEGVWSYHKGTNAPQAGWKTLPDSALDGTWTNGQGGFGYADNFAETNLCNTLLPDMKGLYSTFYMRQQFSIVSTVDTNLHLMLTMDWDDGFIAWLDGVYLTNAYVAGAPAEPAYTAVASASHESSHGNTSPQPSVTYDFGPVGARLSVGTHTLAIIGLNDTLGSSSDFVQLADLFLAPAPLLAHTEVWRYRKGTNAPQSNWKTVADALLDATWASGPGGIGYADNTAETSRCQTLLTDMKNTYGTLYYRRQFATTTTFATNLHIMLSMDWDDGFIAWLDGNYLASEFSPNPPAEPAYSALAIGEHESSLGGSGAQPPTTYDCGPVGTRLAPGMHTLAFMGLNATLGSSDFIQIADLSVEVPPPPPPPITNFPPGWRFIFFGDTRGNSSGAPVDTQILGELARALTNERPAFVLFSGDLIYDGTLGMPAYQIWTNAISPLYRAGIPYYPILGNHDAQGNGAAAFTNMFASMVPANGPAGEVFRTYAFTCSNALLLALDNYTGYGGYSQGTVNQPWINAVLATNRLPHIFTMGHVSAFQVTTDHRSMGEYAPPALRNAFWNSLSNTGAKAVPLRPLSLLRPCPNG